MPANRRTAFAAGLLALPRQSGQSRGKGPQNSGSWPAGAGARCWHSAVAEHCAVPHRSHTAGATSSEPCPSCKCAVFLDGCPASQRPVHTSGQCPPRSHWARRPPDTRPARLRWPASQQPLYTQSGPLMCSVCVCRQPFVRSHRDCLLRISVTTCFGTADSDEPSVRSDAS